MNDHGPPKGETAKHARRWWWAGLLNLFAFGGGYLYVGRPWRALVAVGTILALTVLAPALGGWTAAAPLLSMVAIVAIAAIIPAMVFFIIDAIRIACRSREFAPHWYNRWWVYLGVLLASALVIEVRPIPAIKTYSIPSGSMMPTLQVGDYVIADRRAYNGREPSRGDVVAYLLPRDNSTSFVSRLIGLPGDEIVVRDGVVYINGQAVPKARKGDFVWPDEDRPIARYEEVLPNGAKYFVLDTIPNGAYDNAGPFKVPSDHYFMMGDNRDNATDSREQSPRYGVGYVPRNNIVGKFQYVIWSRALSRIGERIH